MCANATDLGGNSILREDSPEDISKKDNIIVRLQRCPGFGIACAIISALFYTLNSVFVKMINDVHPIQISLSRASGQFFILLPLMFYKRDKVDILGPPGSRKFIWMRGFTGSTSMMFLYMAIDVLMVGSAVTIAYLSMIMVPFIARAFLKESLTVLDLVFAIVSLTGVTLIAQPTFLFKLPEGQQPPSDGIGVLYALLSATLQAATLVLIKRLGRNTYVHLHVLYYSACGSFITSVALTILQDFRFPCFSDLPYVFILGVSGICGQMFVTLALQTERAGTVGVLRSTQIIFVYILQVAIFGDIPSTLTLIGTILVLSTSIGIGVRKIVNEQKRRKSF